ncbi:tyrosine-protein kinase transmembrane receptor Ror [Teleopsis dalmanni]|uniref:tyrosine-protein kinase transmembrane receptor Ror n=1 Tax=Teleopsis dalmanni TaxID=139649 RepID=UPI000D32D22E|nr:tyrosine-protein kinase transmembrane receptor Ror [Teleopsis dalmanni]
MFTKSLLTLTLILASTYVGQGAEHDEMLITDSRDNHRGNNDNTGSKSSEVTKSLSNHGYTEEIPAGICQIYNGSTCAKYLRNESVFVPPNLSLNELEERLKSAYGVIKESKDMNPNCRIYALPSLCFSSLPLCRTPERTNLLYFSNRATHKERKLRKNHTIIDAGVSTENHIIGGRHRRFLDKNTKERKLFLKRKSSIAYDEGFSGKISSQYPPSRETENLRRICRDECELLENELCQKEYAIAKRHPVIGQKLPLEECQSLPKHSDCSSLGITIDVDTEQNCYWESGTGYRGTLAVSASGKPCLRWSWLMKEISDYPELAGQNYCRNPGNTEDRPWCFVDDKSFEKLIEPCDIPKCADKIWFYIFITFGGIVCLLILYIVLIFFKRRQSNGMTNIQNINTPNADKNIYGNSQVNTSIELSRLNGNNLANEQTTSFSQNLEKSSLLRVPQYTLQDVEFVEELGEGAFGKVYKGQLMQTSGERIFVAVKALKENASFKTQQDFKREIELISDLKHDNIVCILGVVLNKEPYCMLFEYMSNGDLHEFLIANSPNENKCLSQLEFLKISLQISEGMEYLSGHHYVHRDLAARNCLVGDELTVKISDFGLSRDIYSSDYYRVQSKSLLPVRWMPSESILYGKFTTESDVWSFGVVLWEIYSYGMQPYYGHSNQEVINLVRSRQLLSCPEACPTAVYSLMIECWHEQSVRRPSFSEITHRLKVWYQGQMKINNTPTQMTKSFQSNS